MRDSKLSEYRRKRRSDATNEPFGDDGDDASGSAKESAEGTLEGAYVVHLHDAARRHYDLRLEVAGVLASFAVPRGPALDPSERHLAMRTEDHPFEYLEFEDVIPPGQYGAGPMIAWDRGVVTYLEGPAEKELEAGKLHFELRGRKLQGRWALVKLKKPSGSASGVHGERDVKGNEWLLFKKQDAHADPARSIVDELPRSVFSGLTIEELARADEVGRALVLRAKSLGARSTSAASSFSFPHRAPSGARANTSQWRYDPLLDGVRVLAMRRGDVVTLRSEGATTNVEAYYPDVVRALRALPVDDFTLLGDVVAFDAGGHPSARLLAQRAARFAEDARSAVLQIPVVFVASDLLSLGDRDTRSLALVDRRALLADFIRGSGFLRAPAPLEGPLSTILDVCKAHGVRGVEAKRARSKYPDDRAPRDAWLVVANGTAIEPIVHAPVRAKSTRHVEVSNRTKVFWPDEGLTKGDLCDYYAAVAPVLLPHLRERPVILVRYPDGIEGKSFYQWNVPPGMPSWVRTLPFKDEQGSVKRGFLIDDPATLLYVANLGCIPLHVLACRVPALEEANFFTVDFDVKQASLKDAIVLARTLREILEGIGLPGFPKTSGQSGLHVLVPLGAGQSFTTARALADLVGRLLVERWPALATMDRVVKRRGPKVYVDTGQTGPGRAIVAPYSVRAVAGATVSTPLAWDEIDDALDPRAFTIASVPGRVSRVGDRMKGLLEAAPDVEAAVAKLTKIVGKSRPGGA